MLGPHEEGQTDRPASGSSIGPRSKLVAQGGLNLSCRIEPSVGCTKEGEAGSAKGWVIGRWGSAPRTKYVPVERVWNVELERDYVAFPNRGSLDDRKVLLHIAGASPIAESRRKVPIDESSSVGQ